LARHAPTAVKSCRPECWQLYLSVATQRATRSRRWKIPTSP